MATDAQENFKQRVSQFDFIRFVMSDFHGIQKGKVVPARNAAALVDSGTTVWCGLIAMNPVGTPCDQIKKCLENHQGNVDLIPMVETLHKVTWTSSKYKEGCVLCETRWRDGSPQEAHPRFVARKQLKALEDMGYLFMSGFEHELDFVERDTGKGMDDSLQYMLMNNLVSDARFLYHLDKALDQIGINVDTFHSEYGKGQYEITCKPRFGIQAADEGFILRQALKEISEQNGYQCSFMSKRSLEHATGAHLTLSLWDMKKERNVFHDADDPDKISDICKYFIGGLLHHVGTLCALCNPTVNCYRRLHMPWAPDVFNYGIDDRTATFRVKNSSPKATMIENRLPGGAANVYLSTAVTIAAGIDGIRNKIQPPPMYQQGDQAPQFPSTLEEALRQLEKDEVIVEALGLEFVEWFVKTKRDLEVSQLEGFDPKVFPDEWQEKEWTMYKNI